MGGMCMRVWGVCVRLGVRYACVETAHLPDARRWPLVG